MLARAEVEIAPARLALIGVGTRGERLARQAACGFPRGEMIAGDRRSRIRDLDRADPDVVIALSGLERSSLDDLEAIVRAARSFHMCTIVIGVWPAGVRDPDHLAAIEELAGAASSFLSLPGRPGAEGLPHDVIALEGAAITAARTLSEMVRREQGGILEVMQVFDLFAAGGLSVVGTATAGEHDFEAALERALEAPSLEGAELSRMRRIHVQLRCSLKRSPEEVNRAVRRLRWRFDVCGQVTFSLVFEPALGARVRATVLGSRWEGAPPPGPPRRGPGPGNALPFPAAK